MADMPPHISTVFKELFDELKSAKQQQWTITNYGLLVLAAIYAVRQQLPEVLHSQSKLKFLAIATAVVGSGLLLRIQSHMARTRRRLDKLHKTYFTPNELRDIGLTDKERTNLEHETWRHYFRQWRRGWEFLLALILVLVAGAVLVCFAL